MPNQNYINPELTGIGSLQIGAFALDVGRPVGNAMVRITQKGNSQNIIHQFITDSSGQTPVVELATPPLEYSMQFDMPKPYSEYDVIVLVEGYEPTAVSGVQLFPDTIACQDVKLNPVATPERQLRVIPINEPTLWGSYPPKIPEAEVKPLPESLGFVVLAKPVIPEFIIVHDGYPTNASAKDYWVPFKDYIKNVASCEIYSNWPGATIKANVLAILSFALNRVYTEWYRSKGYNFTITNSTAFDQAFTYGRNIYEEISIIVDEIFTTYITRPGIKQPLFAQYCDGKKVKCPNWMTQWGAKDLGDKGYNSIDILKNFYGQDIYLMQAEKVAGVPMSFSGVNLQVGSTGPDVRAIQEQLNAISNNYPAIKKVKVDGVYGESTRIAVETFQEIFRLSSDGIVGFATWYKISQIYVAVTRMAELK